MPKTPALIFLLLYHIHLFIFFTAVQAFLYAFQAFISKCNYITSNPLPSILKNRIGIKNILYTINQGTPFF